MSVVVMNVGVSMNCVFLFDKRNELNFTSCNRRLLAFGKMCGR